jgi:glycosyltransferase EpsE
MVEISVIMAVYNIKDEDILKLSIHSILNQTFHNLELIICDDGSTDCTYEILQTLARTNPRVILIRNETNLKASVARNRCINIATGRFIAIMDADDYSAPDRLEQQRSFLIENSHVAFVGSRGRFFKKSVGEETEDYWYCPSPRPTDFLFTLPFVHASLMFRREVLQDARGYSESKLVIRSEDYDMLMNLYVLGYYGENLDAPLYYIRQDENTYKRRKYRFRINECFVKGKGFWRLGLMPAALPYVLKPLLVGLIPFRLLIFLKKFRLTKLHDKDN